MTADAYACPPTGWRYEQKRMMQLIASDEVLFPPTNEGRPRRKRFLANAKREFTGKSTMLETVFNISRKPDIGFRVFKLDSSNLQKWDGSYVPPENIDLFLDRAEHSLDNMKPDRRDIDMVYEVFLKYGVPLTEKLATLQVQGKTFYVVGDTGYLMICLEKGITVELIEEMITLHTPGAVIFADQCFADDDELTNAGLALDKAQIEFRWI